MFFLKNQVVRIGVLQPWQVALRAIHRHAWLVGMVLPALRLKSMPVCGVNCSTAAAEFM